MFRSRCISSPRATRAWGSASAHRRNLVFGSILTLAPMVLMAGCAVTAPAPEAAPPVEVGAAAKMLPAEYQGGTITIAVGTDAPPYHYLGADGQPAGVDPDIARAIGQDLGVEVEIVAIPFETIIAGLESDRYDLAIPAFSITPERLAVLDFVTFVTDKSAFMTLADADFEVDSAEDLCGHSWAVGKGRKEEKILTEQAAACLEAGLPELTISTFSSVTDAATAARSGRTDGVANTYSQLAYAASQADDVFEIQDYTDFEESLAIGFKKGSTLPGAVLQALKDLQDNGTYEEILEANGVPGLALDDPEIVTG
jgi:polar amino acid transport system substrate-binding protein